MTKKKNDAKRPPKGLAEIELVHDAWPRFETFIREIAKAGPQHRVPAKPKAKVEKSPKSEKKATPRRG